METLRLQTVAGTLTEDQQTCFDAFVQLCYQKKLLQRPEDLQQWDLIDGLNDEHTLLLVIIITILYRAYPIDQTIDDSSEGVHLMSMKRINSSKIH